MKNKKTCILIKVVLWCFAERQNPITCKIEKVEDLQNGKQEEQQED